MKIKNTRLAKAAAEATDAFWCEFASHFPEITTADMSPEECVAFDWAVTKATGAWIENNAPSQTLNSHCHTCCTRRMQTLRQNDVDIIWLKCTKCDSQRILTLEDLHHIE